ncbi:hypothetical protein [uncultured Hymenobacter sp.]|uniref:hypothetical protein n=1 Tax=uncultured Hymenobacter sp. TaxID=170016 RepID=UPI0035CC9BFA
MSLLTSVLVRGINNLSDARYCAGMGADGLIFTLDPALPSAVDTATVKELAGWVSGVEIIGEFGITADFDTINAIASTCGLTRTVLPLPASPLPSTSLQIPAIIELSLKDAWNGYAHYNNLRAPLSTKFPLGYTLMTEFAPWVSDTELESYAELAARYPLWVSLTTADLPFVKQLSTLPIAGLILQGGNEIKPGLRDFSELEAVFEALEA